VQNEHRGGSEIEQKRKNVQEEKSRFHSCSVVSAEALRGDSTVCGPGKTPTPKKDKGEKEGEMQDERVTPTLRHRGRGGR